MKTINIYDGSRHMTEINAARHYLMRAIKLGKYGGYIEKEKLIKEAMREFSLDIDICSYCACDDFGYCGLRHEKIEESVKIEKYCFNAFIKQLRTIVNSTRNKNGRAVVL